MAYSRNSNNDNRKKAGGFLNIWFKLPNGEYRKVGDQGVALYESNGLSKSMLTHALKNPEFEYQVFGRIKLWNPDAEVELVDLFGSPIAPEPVQVTGTDDSIPF